MFSFVFFVVVSFGSVLSEPNNESQFLCVLTRTRDDHTTLDSFVEHYKHEGATRIILIDDRSEPSLSSTELALDPVVSIIPTDFSHFQLKKAEHGGSLRFEAASLSTFLPNVRSCEWVLSVDTDEYATTRANKHLTIADELRTTFKAVDYVYIKWLSFGFDPKFSVVDDPRKQLTMRMNYTEHFKRTPKHKSSNGRRRLFPTTKGGKTLFRPAKVDSSRGFLTVHKLAMTQDAIEGHICPPGTFEEDLIPKCIILINHYRFLGYKQIRKKCERGLGNFQSSYNHAAAMGIRECTSDILNTSLSETPDFLLRTKTLERTRIT